MKVNGYIDKSYVDYIGQLIKKGQPLFTLYSPDLVSTEEEYLIAKRGQRRWNLAIPRYCTGIAVAAAFNS